MGTIFLGGNANKMYRIDASAQLTLHTYFDMLHINSTHRNDLAGPFIEEVG